MGLDRARGIVAAALETLERLGDRGWRTVAGDPGSGVRSRSATRDGAVERTEAFDPFESLLGPRG